MPIIFLKGGLTGEEGELKESHGATSADLLPVSAE